MGVICSRDAKGAWEGRGSQKPDPVDASRAVGKINRRSVLIAKAIRTAALNIYEPIATLTF